jgi:pimeloyl-ACP methyl ester carboxylesterase
MCCSAATSAATTQTSNHELVPETPQIVLDGVGHVPMSDDPRLVARTISDLAR